MVEEFRKMVERDGEVSLEAIEEFPIPTWREKLKNVWETAYSEGVSRG